MRNSGRSKFTILTKFVDPWVGGVRGPYSGKVLRLFWGDFFGASERDLGGLRCDLSVKYITAFTLQSFYCQVQSQFFKLSR